MAVRSIEELENTPREKLIEEHDARAPRVEPGVNYYLDELRRRDAASNETTMRRLTWAIAFMTLIVMGATLVNLWVFLQGG